MFYLFSLLFLISYSSFSQHTGTVKYLHNKEPTIRYHTKGNDFVIANGKDAVIALMSVTLQRN
ncbi:MAG TPA: hypothetical protein VKB95_03545 [Chitinophagaceae bacterium]|nr:hypothetical protein [Chitinophagaceae bacterium]